MKLQKRNYNFVCHQERRDTFRSNGLVGRQLGSIFEKPISLDVTHNFLCNLYQYILSNSSAIAH